MSAETDSVDVSPGVDASVTTGPWSGDPPARPTLLELLNDTADGLADVGLRMEILSFREGHAIVRGQAANASVSIETVCELSRRSLDKVLSAGHYARAQLIETRCGCHHSGRACTFSLDWSSDQGNGATLTAVVSPATRIAGTEMVPSELDGHQNALAEIASTEFDEARAQAERQHRQRRHVIPRWVGRRWWLFVLCVIAGTSGGVYMRLSHPPTYSASTEMIVASGASGLGPGPANDAIALALTDASIIPTDQKVLSEMGAKLGVSSDEVGRNLSATAEAGTSVVVVTYKAATPAEAVRAANLATHVITSGPSALPRGSLDTVRLADSARDTSTLHTYGVPLGALLGLVIGLIAILAIERSDPRADQVEDLARATGTPVSAYPGHVSLPELQRLISEVSASPATITLVPLSDAEQLQTSHLCDGLDACTNASQLNFESVGPVETAGASLAEGVGPTMLVVDGGSRLRTVYSTVSRLELLGRGAIWAVLSESRGTKTDVVSRRT
jgi:capsular polysaccharide biosynthesis protein